MKEKSKNRLLTILVILTLFLSIFAFLSLQYGVKIIDEGKPEQSELLVKIYADEVSGVSPHEVEYKSLVINEKEIKELYWDFGDGETSNKENPKHTYSNIGNYNCKLSVTDINGNTKKDSINISVTKNNPPIIKIIADKTTGFRPETVSFDARVFDVEGDDVAYEWKISYPPFFSRERVDTYNEKNFSVKFLRYGMYVATLTVTDEAGNRVTDYLRIEINPSKLEVSVNSLLYTITTLQTGINIIKVILDLLGLSS